MRPLVPPKRYDFSHRSPSRMIRMLPNPRSAFRPPSYRRSNDFMKSSRCTASDTPAFRGGGRARSIKSICAKRGAARKSPRGVYTLPRRGVGTRGFHIHTHKNANFCQPLSLSLSFFYLIPRPGRACTRATTRVSTCA